MSIPLLLLLACTGKNTGIGTGSDTGSRDDTGATGMTPSNLTPPTYSKGDCPILTDGMLDDFATGDTSYQVKVVLPDDPVGAPVIFAWHWLGGTASGIVRSLDLNNLSQDQGVIVLAPNSDGSVFEWHFLDDPQDNPDLLLFEDLLACVSQQYDVDLNRIYSTGMSAGGLWTTYMTMYEAQWLASTAIFSGGTTQGTYSTPDRPLPVLITWGGPSDTYATLSFEDTSTNFANSLLADGSFVVECVHDGGHVIPDEGPAYAWQFMVDHPYTLASEPYADGTLPDAFPDWCSLP
ncbi:MAG: hypothetical protein GXP62_17990 [Oligoflexia bacterium]|nr:hypothetical protein [Oligoflexia bacterium]